MTSTRHHGADAGTADQPTTMRAIVQDGYGTADVLQPGAGRPPRIGDDEVLVRVHAAGLDRGTWHLMTGQPYALRLAFGLRRPKNPVARPGRGRHGRRGRRRGDAVRGRRRGVRRRAGLLRRVRRRPARTSSRRKPANLTFEQAAVVPISGGTALQAVVDVGRVAGRASRCWSSVPPAASAPTPCSWPRRSAPRSPACAARRSSTWCAPSAPTTSSTTPARTSPTGPAATT